MQFSKIFVAAFAAFAAAAPATTKVEERQVEERSLLGLDQLSLINNGIFANSAFGYLSTINNFGFNQVIDPFFATLISQQFNIGQFDLLFNSQIFGIDAFAQLIQLQMLIQIQNLGLFNGFNLANLQLQQLNLGLLGGINQFDFNSILDASIFPQVNAIAQQSVVILKE